VHRIRASRAAQRDRAPEDIVKNLPWRVWNGTRWEKADGTPHISAPPKIGNVANPISTNNLTADASNGGDEELDRVEQGSSRIHLPWYTTQVECAICLEEFAVGDKVRVLPCEHVFHMNEIDDWLINRKKLVSVILLSCALSRLFPVTQLTHHSLDLFLVSRVQDGCYERSSRLSTIPNERGFFKVLV
jgi:E3 ubiquitin-protein ligase RNF13/E3 ubiquitin-protein ligase RNF167